MMRIDRGLTIPDDEILIRFEAASRGPGGQNVNKLATRAVLRFDLGSSPSLSEFQRDRLRTRLAARLTGEGILQLRSDEHRTQLANRRAVLARFSQLLTDALRPVKARRSTRPTAASRTRRLESKRRRSATKQRRGGRDTGED